MALFTDYSWPGNVRELKNTIERLVVVHADKEMLDVADLPPHLRHGLRTPETDVLERDTPFDSAILVFERAYLVNLLERTKGNVSQAAQIAGLSRANLHRKIRQLGLEADRFRS
jgi:transcriptional regulator with PAS, ATPase and Fis domain